MNLFSFCLNWHPSLKRAKVSNEDDPQHEMSLLLKEKVEPRDEMNWSTSLYTCNLLNQDSRIIVMWKLCDISALFKMIIYFSYVNLFNTLLSENPNRFWTIGCIFNVITKKFQSSLPKTVHLVPFILEGTKAVLAFILDFCPTISRISAHSYDRFG